MIDASARLSLLTPEQVPIHFELASLGARTAALLLDLLFMGAALIVYALAVGWLADLVGDRVQALGGPFLLLGLFAIFNFYFVVGELRGQGRTPGKRLVGIRVVARDGGPLSAGLVLARNLTRDFEIYLPIQVLVAGDSVAALGPPWLRGLCFAWLGLVCLFPLLNRHRARLGDLLAGTLVVEQPTATLLPDLTAEAGADPDAAAQAGYRFTDAQLDVYGIHELQVLEQVLRQPPEQQDTALLDSICAKVRRKIEWPPDDAVNDPRAFLLAFYAAQRHRLEHELLMGRRRARKRR
ncbi:MAG: RDD family protein [Deltaproteobacteria bacterium]|nr:RDD family protein [Deltaproteobacteria bacterium]MCB9786215.1 RDD family protein [Deltaproteobacteria bacterium]